MHLGELYTWGSQICRGQNVISDQTSEMKGELSMISKELIFGMISFLIVAQSMIVSHLVKQN